MKIGVLALQGAVREHIQAIEKEGVEAVAVKKLEQLSDVDGLVFPGGESTTMRRLLDRYEMIEPIKQFGMTKPIFGTCAGLILMADHIVGQEQSHFGFINMTVQRNAFGRQKESFETNLNVKDVAEDFRAVFIRAPLIDEVGSNVTVLSTYDDRIVAVRQGHFLAASFHPELTEDNRMHQYFIEMVKQSNNSRP